MTKYCILERGEKFMKELMSKLTIKKGGKCTRLPSSRVWEGRTDVQSYPYKRIGCFHDLNP